MRFTASYDSKAKVLTALVCGLVVVIAILTRSGIATALAAAIIPACYAWSPRGYRVQERSILVERLIGEARFPLEDVREARTAAPDDFAGSIRLFGNGGVFGYYGLFQTSKLGRCTWYVTNLDRAVVVVTGAKTALFSPDDVEGFLAAIRGSVPVAASQPLPDAMRSSGAAKLTGKLIGAVIGIVASGFTAFALLYSPGPPGYSLTSDSLTIHDRFYPVTLYAANVEVTQIRIVDFAADTEWRPSARTNGFANSHYQSGEFRLASGKIVRMYRAGGNQLVLLPPRATGIPVLLEAKEPGALVARIRQQWRAR